MQAEELLKAADPRGALAALQDEIRSNPSDPSRRIFLFQLLALLGQWERAQTQLELVGDMEDEALAMVKVYSEVMNSETHRQAVFAGQSHPLVLGEPSQWMAHLVEAVGAFSNGDWDLFETLNAKGFEDAPGRSGSLNDRPFDWLADADQRLGPVFEMIFNGHYYWVAQENVKRIDIEEPADLRDLIWTPAEVTWTNGGQNIVMMPSRYPHLEDASAADLMARHTDWLPRGEGLYEGVGQRMFVTDSDEVAAMQVRSIVFND